MIEAVGENIRKWLKPGGKKELEKELLSQCGTTRNRKPKRGIRDRLIKIDGDVRRLLENLTGTNSPFVDRRLKELQREKAILEAKLEELVSRSHRDHKEVLAEVSQAIRSFKPVMETANLVEKKQALRKFVKGIRLSPGSDEVELEMYRRPKVNGVSPATRIVRFSLQPNRE